MTLTTILTGVIPLLTKGAEVLLQTRKNRQEQDYELVRMKLEADILADKEIAKVQAEARKAEAETERERLKAIKVLNNVPSGYKWIEAAISLVRAIFGYSAVLIFIASAVNLWQSDSPLLKQTEFAETFSAILFYFFAERSVKKAFGKD